MPQNDNATGKRARTDGGRREDDWTCPSCGNVNFSFRTTCNMRNCDQSRPANHNSKSTAKPLQAPPYGSAGYMGPGAPPVYLGAPPYGSSHLNGSSLPSYNYPFSGGPGYGYGYGSRFSTGSPYGSLHMPGPAPYSSGAVMGVGGMYGMPPLVDRYGLPLPMAHATLGGRPGVYFDESSRKKSTERDDDWTCPNCGNNNFSFRTVCNMRKCNTPKPAAKSENSKGSNQKVPEGSWKCEQCGNMNYPFRTKCNRQNCGAEKPSDANENSEENKSGEDEQ